ncbi:unnamed protein product [Triticum turgidum subsp. durum]|uniref:Mitochondrial carrier protein n=1 Tax=Triticum turgidum subsp. durum TaxID=4567 RepID=A0A9R1AZA3_TRITD|nr:unnamed protein product [Triticum turgidum subsp. durum]
MTDPLSPAQFIPAPDYALSGWGMRFLNMLYILVECSRDIFCYNFRCDFVRLEEQNSVGLDWLDRFGQSIRQKCKLKLTFELLFIRGNGASIARIVPYAALHYMAYEEYRRWIILGFPNVEQGPVLDLVAGSIAGGTAVVSTYPLDLVRTKLAYQVKGAVNLSLRESKPSEQVYKGILDCVKTIYRQNGLKGLYRGMAPSLYGIFPYSGLKFYFYEKMKTHVPEEHRKDIIPKLACGSVAGLLGQTITYPLDVVRRQMQVQAFSLSNLVKGKGTFGSLVMIAKHQGWKQLFSGLSINYLKVVPSVAIGFTVYDSMKDWLNVPSREQAAVVVPVLSEDGSNAAPVHSS